jgi:hypothetical protein
MNIEIKSSRMPVLGWSDISECNCYKRLAKDMIDGDVIIYNTIREFEEEELCVYIFYNNFSKQKLHMVISGRVQFIGRHPDHSAPFTYVFYSLNKVKVSSVDYCKCCGHPDEVILNNKKL